MSKQLIRYDGSETNTLVLSVNAILDDVQTETALGILGYALKPLAGEEFTLDKVVRRNGLTKIYVNWDSTKSRSDDLGFRVDKLHDDIAEYMQDGTPVRTTNRAGTNTKGTRLINGLGVDAMLMVEVESKEYRIQLTVDGKVVYEKHHSSIHTPDVKVKTFIVKN